MTVLLTLTTAGSDSGPFNLYSNLDGYVTAFETGVSKSALVAGYSSSLVPDYATIIRVTSTGSCINHTDITLIEITTTTTTTAAPSIGISTPTCRTTGGCNDNSTCGVDMPVIVYNAPIGYYVEFIINAYTDATASYSSGILIYTESNALGYVNVTLNLYNTYGGTLLAFTTQTINHQSFYQFLPLCSATTTTTTTILT